MKDLDTIMSTGRWEIWHNFEEVECEAADWKMISPAQ